MMNEILLFSNDETILQQWQAKLDDAIVIKNLDQLSVSLDDSKSQVVLFDMDAFDFIIEETLLLIQSVKSSYAFILTGDPSFEKGSVLLSKGIAGYGNSFMQIDNLKMALEVILTNQMWLYPAFMQKLISNIQPSKVTVSDETQLKLNTLTAKEQEVAQCVSKGFSNKEVAQELSITERTVKAHLSNIYIKLSISDRLSLALMFKEL